MIVEVQAQALKSYEDELMKPVQLIHFLKYGSAQ